MSDGAMIASRLSCMQRLHSEVDRMPSLTVRKLDDDVIAALRRRARRNGRSMEAEVRQILRAAALGDGPGMAWLQLAQEWRGDDLDLPTRRPPRGVPDL